MLTQLRIDDEWTDARGLPPRERAWEELEVLDGEPEIDDLARLVLECWFENEGERYLGFSATGPIPPSKVREWCAHEGCDAVLTRLVMDAVRYCDSQRAERISSELAHKG